MKFEYHKMVNESIRDSILKTEREMKDLGLYVCVRPVGFCKKEEPDIEISSLSWHLGNVEDALLDHLDIHPKNDRLRKEFEECALLQIDANKTQSACCVDLYDVYARNNYLDDYDDLCELADELEEKLDEYAIGKVKESIQDYERDTLDVLHVDEFFQHVMDICSDFTEEELSDFNDFYDYAVQKAAEETLPKDFVPNIKGYKENAFCQDIEEFRYAVFERLLNQKDKVSWEDLTYGSYKKGCNTASSTHPVGKVYVGGVRFDVTPQTIADYHFLNFTPHLPKEDKDVPLRSRGILVKGKDPLSYEMFQRSAEHLIGTTILDCGISREAMLGKNPHMSKRYSDTLFR